MRVTERRFRKQWSQGYQRTFGFYEGAGGKAIVAHIRHQAFLDAVRRYQARYRLEQGAVAALRPTP